MQSSTPSSTTRAFTRRSVSGGENGDCIATSILCQNGDCIATSILCHARPGVEPWQMAFNHRAIRRPRRRLKHRAIRQLRRRLKHSSGASPVAAWRRCDEVRYEAKHLTGLQTRTDPRLGSKNSPLTNGRFSESDRALKSCFVSGVNTCIERISCVNSVHCLFTLFTSP